MSEPPVPATLQATAHHVARIIEAAERAAEELRSEAEERARERIAEAERAAMLRVQAADDEADHVRSQAEADAEQLLGEAAAQAQLERERALDRAREVLVEARLVARDVLRDGEIVSGHLRELADALRVNAERLLRDVRDVHQALTARLDRVDPDRAGRERPSKPPARGGAGAPELDVPEFKPRRR
jgi:vacuolar-type H+-ATPase subunit H